MKTVKNPNKSEWNELLSRPALSVEGLYERVQTVLDTVRKGGDKALKGYELQFDKIALDSLAVSQAELDEAAALVPASLRDAIDRAAQNIRKFHESQLPSLSKVETTPGVTCWQKAVPITKVGLYIPGGTAPLFSTVLMLAIPARTAGCSEIVLCTPPGRDGKVNPAILYAAQVAGVNRFFKLGGSQAIAAMAYGTESVPKVSKIFGPGNPYVTAAKQIVSLKDVAIDMPAGPSEVEVIADANANPAFVAADLLSQAEHGRDSQVILLTTSAQLIDKVQAEVDRQVALLPRNEIAQASLQNSRMILLRNDDEIIEMTNEYAPEHLIIQTANASELAERVVNAGSVFIGPWSPESAGDYASGTNHTLPTSGYAKAYSGVNIDSFMRKITFQELTREGLASLGPVIETMAAGESLDAHKNAVTLRLDALGTVPSVDVGPKCPRKEPSLMRTLVRPNIWSLSPYTSARDEYQGKDAKVFLDANENPYNAPFNRYPDPLQRDLKKKIAVIKGVNEQSIFFGNGSDEAIDLMFRMFCRPGIDNAVAIEPTYGMYGVCADINDVEYRRVLMDDNFQPSYDKIMSAVDANTKLIFFCSPNNPSGNNIDRKVIDKVLDTYQGIVIVDEAYIDFAGVPSYLEQLDSRPNLIVLQTFSKAWGMAGIRLGMAFAQPEIIQIMNKVKYPYNINQLTQKRAMEEVMQYDRVQGWVNSILKERTRLMSEFAKLDCTLKVYPSDANFFLARVKDAKATYDYLVGCGIIVRNRSKIALCGNSLRVTVGTAPENNALIDALKKFK